MHDDTTPPTEPDAELADAEHARLLMPPTGPPPPPTDDNDAAFIAWLRSLVAPDGTFRVPRLVVADPQGNDCIVLQRDGYRAEVIVSIPSPPGESTEVAIYADNGDPEHPTLEPSLGASIRVAGNDAATIDAVLDRWGGWELSAWHEPSAPGGRRPR